MPTPYKSAKDMLSPPEMDTSPNEPAPDEGLDDESMEQTTIPKSVCGDVNVGDTVTFKVVSMDGDNVTVQCQDDEAGEDQKMGGKSATDRMAAEFD